MKIRQATLQDLPGILELIEEAKQSLAARGVDQWQNGYPDAMVITNDIQKRQSYVMEANRSIIGTAVILCEEDPNYQKIEDGQWLTSGPYGVVHRIAIHPDHKGQGLAGCFFSYAWQLCQSANCVSLRIDTHQDNEAMQHAIRRFGFTYCGMVQMADGSPRKAYEYIGEEKDHGF